MACAWQHVGIQDQHIYIYIYVLDVMFMEITFPQEALWLSVTFNSHP